jgi:tRNA wybutosine-synthesizing protein 1
MDKSTVAEFKKKQYGVYDHSAVQICSWNKSVLRDLEPCYKQKFYNVNCHRCMQFSPAAFFCNNACIFCWRPTELMTKNDFKKIKVLEPKEMVENLLEERRKLLTGFGGRDNINEKKYKEALLPDHYAISLSGEPMIYPKMAELVKYLREIKKARSIFIVTNGTCPEILKDMIKKDSLPHQFYLSLIAPNKELYENITQNKNSWKDYNEFIDLFKTIDTRKVVRFTLIKNLNDNDDLIDEYTEIFNRINPDFIEIKSYMHIGYSQKRLDRVNMPLFSEVQSFTKKLLEKLDTFELANEHSPSRILVLKNKKTKKELFCFK